MTPLIIAVGAKDLKLTELLIKLGANVDMTDSKLGNTALMVASHFGVLDCLQLLINHGAHLMMRNYFGDTALTMAQNDATIKILTRAMMFRGHKSFPGAAAAR